MIIFLVRVVHWKPASPCKRVCMLFCRTQRNHAWCRKDV